MGAAEIIAGLSDAAKVAMLYPQLASMSIDEVIAELVDAGCLDPAGCHPTDLGLEVAHELRVVKS